MIVKKLAINPISPINPTAQQSELDSAAAKAALITFDSDAPNSKRQGWWARSTRRSLRGSAT